MKTQNIVQQEVMGREKKWSQIFDEKELSSKTCKVSVAGYTLLQVFIHQESTQIGMMSIVIIEKFGSPTAVLENDSNLGSSWEMEHSCLRQAVPIPSMQVQFRLHVRIEPRRHEVTPFVGNAGDQPALCQKGVVVHWSGWTEHDLVVDIVEACSGELQESCGTVKNHPPLNISLIPRFAFAEPVFRDH